MASKSKSKKPSFKVESDSSDVEITPKHNLTLTDTDSDVDTTVSSVKPVETPATVKEESKRGRKPKTTSVSIAAAADTTDDDEPAATSIHSAAKLTSATTIESASEDDNELDGTWTNRLIKNPAEIKTLIDLLEFLKKNYNGMDESSITDIWNKLCNKSMDEMKKLYSKSKKRATKAKAKFQPKDILKPPRSGRQIFMRELTARNKALKTPIKMDIKQQNEEWSKIPQAEKDRYNMIALTAKQEYAQSVEKQKAEAISSGDFPEPPPKRPISSYILFRTEVLPKVKAKLPDIKAVIDDAINGKTPEEQTAIKSKLRKDYNDKVEAAMKDKWTNISAEKKKFYDDAAAKDRVRHQAEVLAWTKRCEERKAAKLAANAN